MNSLTIIGNAGGDPELRYTPNGAAVCSFNLAYQERFLKDGEWKDGETTWIKVNAWRALAENIAESITKGTRVVVTGRIQQRSWETEDGGKRTVIEIQAEDVAPSLKFATASVTRQSSGGGGE